MWLTSSSSSSVRWVYPYDTYRVHLAEYCIVRFARVAIGKGLPSRAGYITIALLVNLVMMGTGHRLTCSVEIEKVWLVQASKIDSDTHVSAGQRWIVEVDVMTYSSMTFGTAPTTGVSSRIRLAKVTHKTVLFLFRFRRPAFDPSLSSLVSF